jgi:hypothetical protein
LKFDALTRLGRVTTRRCPSPTSSRQFSQFQSLPPSLYLQVFPRKNSRDKICLHRHQDAQIVIPRLLVVPHDPPKRQRRLLTTSLCLRPLMLLNLRNLLVLAHRINQTPLVDSFQPKMFHLHHRCVLDLLQSLFAQALQSAAM